MYPYLKLALTLARARYRDRLELEGRSILHSRVGLLDADPFLELNHARHLMYMELGRWDYSYRVGFLELMKQHRWGITVGGVSIRYRRRVPLLHAFDVTTQALCHDARWFYFLQEIRRGEQICSSALIKAGAVDRNGLVPAPQVLTAAGRDDWGHEIPGWVSEWITAEGHRPWPQRETGENSWREGTGE